MEKKLVPWQDDEAFDNELLIFAKNIAELNYIPLDDAINKAEEYFGCIAAWEEQTGNEYDLNDMKIICFCGACHRFYIQKEEKCECRIW